MFLDYLSLGILFVSGTSMIYLFIYLHDIPYSVAKKRNHPQSEAIHVACWLSLFTLHAIWPLVFIWAVSKSPTIKVEGKTLETDDSSKLLKENTELKNKIKELEIEIAKQE